MSDIMFSGIEKLNDTNYETWSSQMRSALQIKRLTKYIVTNLKEEADTEGNLDALAYMRLAVLPNQLRYLKGVTTAHDAWIRIKETHQKVGPAHKMMLFRRLMMPCADIKDALQYIESFYKTVDDLNTAGSDINEEVLVYMLLNGLPKSFEKFEVAMTARESLPKLSELKVKVEDEYARQIAASSDPVPEEADEQVWVAHNNQTSSRCFKCGGSGHWAKQCKVNKFKSAQQQHRSGFIALGLKADVKRSDWILDSGATSHLLCDNELFESYTTSDQPEVLVANGQRHRALQTGIVVINNHRNEEIELREVLYTPDIKMNLFSVKRATDAGYKVVFEKAMASVIGPDGEIKIKAQMVNGLWIIIESERVPVNSALIGQTSAAIEVWHRRLGHLNYDAIKKMSRDSIVKGIQVNNNLSPRQCEVCIKNKLREDSYPTVHRNSAKEILERVHSDICGPFQTRAKNGELYFATFVDEKSRYLKIYNIKSRSEIGAVFGDFKNFVEKQTGKQIKAVRTDNAAEYKGGRFAEIIKNSGIAHETTVPHCPPQNGIAERVNLTLINMVKCMLEDANLPKHFWAEALHTACYLKNRSASRVINGMTPFESFWGFKPNIQHLREFGCRAIALNKGWPRKKLDARGRECQLIGYSSHNKGYRLVDSRTMNVFISRTVKFLGEGADELKIDLSDHQGASSETVAVPPRRNPSRAVKDVRPIPIMSLKDEQKAKQVKVSNGLREEDQQPRSEGASTSIDINQHEAVPKDPESYEDAKNSKWWGNW